MAAQIQGLHFLVVPFMSQSNIIPMTDFAKLLAQRGLTVTIITTPLNARPLKDIIDRAHKAGLNIQLISLRFPGQEAGLPEGCENMDSLPSSDLAKRFFEASEMMREPLEKLVGELEPRPSCIVSASSVAWTCRVAKKFKIPRYVFQTISSFSLLCSHNVGRFNVHDNLKSDTERFVVPNMPDHIELTKSQLPDVVITMRDDMKDFIGKMVEAHQLTEGVLVNSFEEMEPRYVEENKKLNKKFWCVGPVSQSNKEMADKLDRGNKASIDGDSCLKWLDSMKPSSVIYACFGSLGRIPPLQVMEIGLGLEASNRPFIWIIRGINQTVEKWLEEERFEEKVKGRGLIIRGWAPQVLILSHPSVGGFITHCGWNSTLEGLCAGVPMITWPMFAEQFYNEKLILQILRIGVRVGSEVSVKPEEEGKVSVKSEQVKEAIDTLMDEGEEGGERRKRARELGEMGKRAIEEGGSSYLNITMLIEDVMQFVNQNESILE